MIYFMWSRWTAFWALLGTLTLLLVAVLVWKTSLDERSGAPSTYARPIFRVLAGVVSTGAFAVGVSSAVLIVREFTASTDALLLMVSAVCVGVGGVMAYVAVTGTSPIKVDQSGFTKNG